MRVPDRAVDRPAAPRCPAWCRPAAPPRGPGRPRVGHRQAAGLDAVDRGHREGHVLRARGARVLDDLAADVHRRVLDRAARSAASGTRSVTFSIRIRVTWICMPVDDRRGRRRARPCRPARSGAPAAASRPPTLGAARRTVRTTPPSSICDGLGADHRQRHPGQRNPAAARGRGRGGVGHRQLGQRLVDGRGRRPHLLGARGRPARSAAAGCAAARCSSASLHRRIGGRDTGRRARRRRSRSPRRCRSPATSWSSRSSAVPSTISVTVLALATAKPPAKASTSSSARDQSRSIGDGA